MADPVFLFLKQKEGMRNGKKATLENQMRSTLLNQFRKGYGTSRHQEKQLRGTYAIHDKIYSKKSLDTHVSRTKMFAKWVKQNHPEIKKIDQISKVIVGEYLQSQQDKGLSAWTLSADLTALNHVAIGTGVWDKSISKSEFGIKKRSLSDVKNNRGDKATDKHWSNSNRYEKETFVGQAFGLRRSELVPSSSNRGYAVTNQSLYKVNKKVYCATFGKGSRYRTVECLKSHQNQIEQMYGQYIIEVDRLPKSSEFKEIRQQGEALFNSISRSVNIHQNCRQYYANAKLEELQQENRYYEVQEQNRPDLETYRCNGQQIDRGHAQFISQQLGHNRLDVLKHYINA